jgi:hypothetical protein
MNKSAEIVHALLETAGIAVNGNQRALHQDIYFF